MAPKAVTVGAVGAGACVAGCTALSFVTAPGGVQLAQGRAQRPQLRHATAAAEQLGAGAASPLWGMGAAAAGLAAAAAAATTKARAKARGRGSVAARALARAEADLETGLHVAGAGDKIVLPRRNLVQSSGAVALGSGLLVPTGADASTADWVQYDLNTGETLYDIAFDPNDANHGFIVGARGLFYETKDGGRRWVSRSFTNLGRKGENIQFRFQAVSIKDDDVWILGKPPLLLHSKDGGKSWAKVPLSRKLPGQPQVITALSAGVAEMATSSGAVYRTENNGRNWKSQVRETVDATLNRVSSSGVQGASYFTGSVKSVKRDVSGAYLAVAQRGNFYLTYQPGEDYWLPHNRVSARRIQAMGFRDCANGAENPGAWMSLNGGYYTSTENQEFLEGKKEPKDLFKFTKIRTGGLGIIDVAWRNATEAFAVGGSGIIYYSTDGGKSWQFDSSGNDLPCNLYNVKFFDNGNVGCMIGSNGILLRRQFAKA